MTFLIALAAALAPAMPIRMVATPELVKLRDWWLLASLALGAIALTVHGEAWLGLMALWFLCRWRGPELLPSLVTWGAIGACWFMLRGLPAWAWTYLPWAWLAVAAYHVGVCAYYSWTVPTPYERRPLWGLWRTKAYQGSPAITALFFALVSPFCPWWGWPVLALGLYLTWSWLAFIGVAVGLAVLHPAWAGWIAVSGLLVLATWGISWKFGVKLFEWTPRGDSFDSVINRLIVWALLVQGWWRGPRILGHGPYSVDRELRRWSSRCYIELPNGEACVDGLQFLYEYGLLGAAAAGGLLISLMLRVHWGDPWSAACAAGLAMSFGHYPLRQPAIALMWLTIAAGVGR